MWLQVFYKLVFYQLVYDFNFCSVFDVGCGLGCWVWELWVQDINVIGIDILFYVYVINLFVKIGCVSELLVEDQFFDLVCSEFSVYYFCDLVGYLCEVCWVVMCGIVILDFWYDDIILFQ